MSDDDITYKVVHMNDKDGYPLLYAVAKYVNGVRQPGVVTSWTQKKTAMVKAAQLRKQKDNGENK